MWLFYWYALFYDMDVVLLKEKLDRGQPPSSIILSGARLLNPGFRESPIYSDPTYYPFYYHLGSQLNGNPLRVAQIGHQFGLVGMAFMAGFHKDCRWEIFDETLEFKNVINMNISKHGSVEVCFNPMRTFCEERQRDLTLLTRECSKEDYRQHLESLWNGLKLGGLLVADYITQTGNVFHEFCRVKNREPVLFKTRYGVGIVER